MDRKKKRLEDSREAEEEADTRFEVKSGTSFTRD